MIPNATRASASVLSSCSARCAFSFTRATRSSDLRAAEVAEERNRAGQAGVRPGEVRVGRDRGFERPRRPLEAQVAAG